MNNSGPSLDKINKLLESSGEKISIDEFNKFRETSQTLNQDINNLFKGYSSGKSIDQIDLSIKSELNEESKAYLDKVMKENLNSIKHMSSDIEQISLNFTEDGVQMGGSMMFESWLDYIELGLDILGFIPAAGIFIDASSALLALIRGKYWDAFFSAVNMIPIVGSFVGTPGKYILRFYRIRKSQLKAQKMRKASRMGRRRRGNRSKDREDRDGYEPVEMEYEEEYNDDEGDYYEDEEEYYEDE